jgi:ribonuclease HI
VTRHAEELKNYLLKCTEKPDIICIQETFLKPLKSFNLPEYDCVRKDREGGRGGGIATFIKSGIDYKIKETNCTLECIIIELLSGVSILTIVNVYDPPNKVTNEEDYKNIFNLTKSAIIVGDFNAHNTMWKSDRSDRRGLYIEKMLEGFNYVSLNTGIPTYQKTNGGMSVLDLSFASSAIANKCEWSIAENNTWGSDHIACVTRFGENIDKENNSSLKWNLKKADWILYKKAFDSDTLNNLYSDNIDMYCDNFTKEILRAAKVSIPQTRSGLISSHLKTLPYWTQNISDLIKERNKARNKVNKLNSEENRINYKRLKAKVQLQIKNESKKYWNKYCSSLNRGSKLGSVWRMSHRMNGKNNQAFKISALEMNGKNLTTNKEKAEALAETFSNVSSDKNFSKEFQCHKINFEKNNKKDFSDDSGITERNNAYNVPYTKSELMSAISSCKNKKSAGKDTIVYEFIKQAPDILIEYLLKFYNEIWHRGIIPQAWRHAVILPLRKIDKPASDPASYRPISLTSCLCKIMEKLVTTRLTFYLESNHLLNDCQSGFRKHKSTSDQIIKLQDTISKYNKNKGFTVGVFLDFEKAYDMLWRAGLMTKIKKAGINGNLFTFINEFINNRTFEVKIGAESSSKRALQNGTPQGSVLSPILFLIMINDIDIGETGAELSLFADDSATYKSGRNLKKIMKDIQNSLDNISKWANMWGMRISTSKSSCVIFTNKTKLQRTKPLILNGQNMKVDDKVKFLGIILDKRLTWKYHFEYIENKCKKRLNLIRKLTGTQWGASKESLLTIYRALIRSLLDYGAEVLDSASQNMKAKFDVIQSKCLRLCCGAMIGTTLTSLQNECGELPLELRRYKQQLNYVTKIKVTEYHTNKNILKDHWTNHYGMKCKRNTSLFNKTAKFIDSKDMNEVSLSKDVPWLIEDFDIDKSLSKRLSKTDPALNCKMLALEVISHYENSLAVYTDGSRDESSSTGASFYIPEANTSTGLRLTDKISVFSTELTAVRITLEWIIKNQTTAILQGNRNIAIFTDSLSSVQSLESRYSKTRQDLINDIFVLKKNIPNPITIVWIPSHVGIKGNEIADILAKQALKSPTVDFHVNFGLIELYEEINHHVLQLWQTQWYTTQKGAHYRSIQPLVSNKIKYADRNNRAKEVLISRLRLGKCRLNFYQQQLRMHPTGLCDTCRVPETIDHYVLHCTENQIFKELQIKCDSLQIKCSLQNALSVSDLMHIVFKNTKRNL